MTAIHRVLGAPRGLVLPVSRGSKSRTAGVGWSAGRRIRCPNQRRRLWVAMVDAGGCPVRSLRAAFVTRSVQWMPKTRLRARKSKPSSLLARVVFNVHVSAPEKNYKDNRFFKFQDLSRLVRIVAFTEYLLTDRAPLNY